MSRGRRVFVSALLLSMAIHALLAGNAAHWWLAPAREIPFPIEAHLLGQAAPSAIPEPQPAARTSAPSPRAISEAAAPAPEMAEATPPPVSSPAPAPPEPEAIRPDALPQTETPAQVAPGPPVPAPAPAPAAAPARALRALPEKLALVYAVQAGEGGFNIGRTAYTWQARDGRYSLTSVAEATGLIALFASGKIVQSSEGRVTASGLQPELYALAKGDRRQPPVQFDWGQRRLLLPGGGIELPELAQDLLSFAFHLAMTVRDGDGEWRLPVTNGKTLREYGFRIVGHETLAVGESAVETLHLLGGRPGSGSLDVWLAPSRHWLPTRIRTLDQKGKTLVLSLENVE